MRLPLSVPILLVVFAEIAAYVVVGEAIGVLATLGLTLAGMVAGVALLRVQGLAALKRLRADHAAGRAPVAALADGAVLAGAAVLMIIPGLITSAIGLLLFVPPVRALLLRRLGRSAATAPVGTRKRRAGAPAQVVELGPEDYSPSPSADGPWRPGG